MKNNSFLLNQIQGGTVVKIATMDEYDMFLKRCTEGQVLFFTHQVDAKKPTRIVLLGLPDEYQLFLNWIPTVDIQLSILL
jgi:hypothetical protein